MGRKEWTKKLFYFYEKAVDMLEFQLSQTQCSKSQLTSFPSTFNLFSMTVDKMHKYNFFQIFYTSKCITDCRIRDGIWWVCANGQVLVVRRWCRSESVVAMVKEWLCSEEITLMNYKKFKNLIEIFKNIRMSLNILIKLEEKN